MQERQQVGFAYKDLQSLGLFTKIYKDLSSLIKFLLMTVRPFCYNYIHLSYYIFQTPANYHSKMMKLVFAILILQLASAASSTKKDHTQATSGGLISYKNPVTKAFLPVTLAAAKKNIVKRQAGCGCGGDRAVFDRSCRRGGLGCNACGRRLCRFCGFGIYRRC